METSEDDYGSKYRQILHHINLGGSTMSNVFFVGILCGKGLKTLNYSFRLQKEVEKDDKFRF